MERESKGKWDTLTREKFQVRSRGDEDLGSANVDSPPVGVFLVDNVELVTFGESGFFRRGARVVVEGFGLGSCG